MPETKSADRGQIIAPGAVIGVLGGGQLGRMTAMAAARLGYRVHTYCPDRDSPASHVSWHNTVAAYLYDHDVDELQASYVPAAPGQRVFEASYSEGANGEDEIWCCEVPVVAWRIERGDVEPIGPEGKIGDASNSCWMMMCPDGRVIYAHSGTYDSLELALEALKGELKTRAQNSKTRARKLQNAG